jgi:O-antigen ligase
MQARVSGGRAASGMYWTILVLFNLYLVTGWMPRISTIGGTDIGVGAAMLALLLPLIILTPGRAVIDDRAAAMRFLIIVSICFVIFWGFLGMYRIDQPQRAGRLFLSLGQGVVLITLVTSTLSSKALRFSLMVCVVMLAINSVLSFIGFLGGELQSLTYLQRDRSSGLFKNPNQYGMIAAMATPFAVALFFQKGKTVLATVILCLAFVGLLTAASKTNLLIALVMVFATIAYGQYSTGRAKTMLVSLPVLCVIVWWGGMPVLEQFNPRAAEIIQSKLIERNAGNSTLDQRFELWNYSLKVMQSSPMFGEGVGQRIKVADQDLSHSHNVFLDMGRTVGIQGMAGTTMILVTIIWLAFKTLARVAAIPITLAAQMPGRAIVIGSGFAVLSYILSNQMSDSLGPSTSIFFWLCTGLLLRRHDLLFTDEPVYEQV